MQLKLLACEILRSEICSLTGSLPHHVDVEFLPMELHAASRNVRKNCLAKSIANADDCNYDALLLAYGLCSGSLAGLAAGSIPLVVPKAHDCMTLFLGCRKRYKDYFFANGGTYFLTAGWLEQENAFNCAGSSDVEMMPHYNKIAFIETAGDGQQTAVEAAKQIAEERNWEFEKLAGDLSLLQRLILGDWDEDFLIVRPGEIIRESHNDEVIEVGAN